MSAWATQAFAQQAGFASTPGADQLDFSGPYIGGTLGSLLTGESITTSAVLGFNFKPTDNLLLGVELSGRLYNDKAMSSGRPTANDDYALHGKIGATFDRFAAYGLAGLGADSKLGTGVYEVGAGAEVGVTDHLSLVGQLVASAPFNRLPNTFHVEGGVRYHFSGFSPYMSGSGGGDAPFGLSGVADLANNLGVSEVRVGGAVSNIELSPYRMLFTPYLASFQKARLDTVTLDVLFDSPWLISWAGGPRPYLGTVVNAAGYESSAHAGLNWHWDFANTPLYAELGGGLAVHNGYLDKAPAGYRNLGCPVLTQWQYALGANVTKNMTVTAEYQHISGYLFGCSPNEGVNNFGVSVGWKF